MIVYKILAGLIFCLLGILVFIKGLREIRTKGIRLSSIDMTAGVVFLFIGLLIWLGYFG